MPDPNDMAAIIEEGLRVLREGEQDDYWLHAATHFPALALAIAAHRQQVAALAAATLCGTVAFRGDDGSGESIVAIRFDCRTEADEFVKLLESLGDRQ
jgi:hypothetical protein